MSANLSIFNGKAEAAYGLNQPAWHGQGTVVDGLMSASEVLDLAHLGWDVEMLPLLTERGIKVPDNFAVQRSDKPYSDGILGVVGNKYTPLQNREAFGFFDGIVNDGEAMYECAGALDGGKRVWILARVSDVLTINGNDPVQPYVLLCNSHDGSSSFIAKLTSVRVVCQNTLSAALNKKGECIRIKHCASITEKLVEGARVLGLARIQAEEQAQAFGYMAGVQFDSTMLAYFLCSVLPATGERKGKAIAARQAVQSLFEGKGKGADIAGTTAWGAYNAVAEYVDHVKTFRGDKMQSVWFGRGSQLTKTAFKVASTIETVQPAEMAEVIKAQSA